MGISTPSISYTTQNYLLYKSMHIDKKSFSIKESLNDNLTLFKRCFTQRKYCTNGNTSKTPFEILICLSEIITNPSRSPKESFNYWKNHFQEASFSESTILNARGKILLLPSIVVVVNNVPPYLHFKNVSNLQLMMP